MPVRRVQLASTSVLPRVLSAVPPLAFVSVLVLGFALGCALSACATASSTAVAPASAPPAIVTLGGESVRAYVADDPDERSRGLQGYAPLADGEGMVFVYADNDIRVFAMKDVTFPIDVVFIAEDMTVSAIEPLDPDETRTVSSPGPSRYVVELPQGWAAENGIVAGSIFSVSYDSH